MARGLRTVSRVEFWKPGVLNDDAREALTFLTRPTPCACLRVRASRSVRWIEPKTDRKGKSWPYHSAAHLNLCCS